MPSSGPPTEYQRATQRFFYAGMSLMPQDALKDGKQAWIKNMRSYEEGTLEVRYGLDPLLDAPLADPIHSIFRLNDPTPSGLNAARFLGAGTALYAGDVASAAPTVIDSGYSGNPMTAVAGDAYRTPRPFLYLADFDRLQKFDTALNNFSWGIATPTEPPTAELAAPQSTYLDSIGGAAVWQGYGPNVAPPGVLAPLDRINTTVTQLLYDSGATGMASVAVASFENFTPGCVVDIGAAPESIIVQSIHPPVGPTTIAAILYDSGTTGPCSIQPTGGFSVGQIEVAAPAEVEARYRALDHLEDPTPPRVTVTRTVDFPVDSLILLGGTEVVRIESVAIGPDDVLSFRCTTLGTFAAGAAITGLASFRGYFNTTKSVGDAVVEKAVEVTLTPATTGDPDVGGFQEGILPTRNWTLVGNRASTPDDIIRFGFKCSLLGYVEFIRIMIDVSVTGQPYESDYYIYEWRAADLIAAIQATSEATTASFITGQGTAVEHGQTSSIYNDQYAQGQVTAGDPVVGTTAAGGNIRRPIWHGRGTAQPSAPPTPKQHYRNLGERARAAVERVKAAKTAPVVAGSSISRQLALGNDVWMTLECRIGDLTRIGTRTDLNLTAITNACIYAQVVGTVTPVVLQMSDPYLTGGYGPDVGITLPPYVYRYSYRSTLTGERSNTSPPMRAGVRPQRSRVELTAPMSSAAQCDVIDWWRFGGALANWAYVTTTPNDPSLSPPTASTHDDMSDGQIDGGPTPRVDLFQPWPTTDLPRSGTCTVAGTSVQWASGDVFNPSWSADTLIVIGGRATSLYSQPDSTTRLQVVDNVGSGTVDFQIPSPLLVSQPLPIVFGGLISGTLFHFAVGDPNDPGNLHWSNANDPDSSSDANIIAVSAAAEPLMNGYLNNGRGFVFSTERLFAISPTPGDVSTFRVTETNCTRGLWSRWAFALDPDGGCYFLAKDGWYRTEDGSDATPVGGPDLRPLFPHDGSVTDAIRNLAPIDFSQPNRLRATFVGWTLYFDYVDTNGIAQTLLYEPKFDRWSYDTYNENDLVTPPTTAGVTVRYSEPGQQVLDHLIATEDAQLNNYTITKITDGLLGIQWAVWTPWANGNDARSHKQWGDAIVDMNAGGSQAGVQVTPVIDNGNVALDPRILGQSVNQRDTYLVEVGANSQSGYGVLSRNFGLWIQGCCQTCDVQRPILYLWEPAFLLKGTSVARRATDWEDLGYKGTKFVQGIVIRANTFNQQKGVQVQFDGPNGTPQVAMTLPLLHDGEQAIAYPNSNDGWQPFHAELVRLQGADDVDWSLLDWRWVWEPAPEAATQWETQETTFDWPGFGSVRDGVMAYAADAPVELVVQHDQAPISYLLPATTNGEYQRVYIPFGPYKGKSVKFQWFCDQSFRLYKRDCSVRVQGWGLPGGYQVVNPFGGPHRVDGAGI